MTPEDLREACEKLAETYIWDDITAAEGALLREVARECLSLLPDALRWRALCEMADGLPFGMSDHVRTKLALAMSSADLAAVADAWIAVKAGRGSE